LLLAAAVPRGFELCVYIEARSVRRSVGVDVVREIKKKTEAASIALEGLGQFHRRALVRDEKKTKRT